MVALAALLAVLWMPAAQGLPPTGQVMLAVLAFAVIVWMTEALARCGPETGGTGDPCVAKEERLLLSRLRGERCGDRRTDDAASRVSGAPR